VRHEIGAEGVTDAIVGGRAAAQAIVDGIAISNTEGART
jgi:hypothetical protein